MPPTGATVYSGSGSVGSPLPQESSGASASSTLTPRSIARSDRPELGPAIQIVVRPSVTVTTRPPRRYGSAERAGFPARGQGAILQFDAFRTPALPLRVLAPRRRQPDR